MHNESFRQLPLQTKLVETSLPTTTHWRQKRSKKSLKESFTMQAKMLPEVQKAHL
jgi:hypothetical protein